MVAKRGLQALEERRVEGARLIKRKVSQAEVARRLGVSRQAVSDRARKFAEVNGAVGKLSAKPLGRPKHLDASQCAALSGLLLMCALATGFPTKLWTVKRVGVLIKRELSVAYSNTGGWELLRGLGFTPQRPEMRALQRDEEAIV